MVNLSTLLSSRGDARQLVEIPEGPFEWSDKLLLGSFEIIKAVQFHNFDITDCEVCINFVECEFSDCKLRNLKSFGHLWGADDYWSDCTFESCYFEQMRSPMNTFSKCLFDKVEINGYSPYQTVFHACEFNESSFSGMKPRSISNSAMTNSMLIQIPGQVLFRDCSFVNVEFRDCYFQDVAFERCTWEKTNAHNCSFDGVISDVTWWREQKTDPFSNFLFKALEIIRKKCGTDSAAYKEFENYVIDYGAGRNVSRDFSACLYNNRVPYAETQKVIKELRKLVILHQISHSKNEPTRQPTAMDMLWNGLLR